jgi:hypothetical protein
MRCATPNCKDGKTSGETAEFGVITCMYTARAAHNHGFAGMVPGILQCLALLLVGLKDSPVNGTYATIARRMSGS